MERFLMSSDLIYKMEALVQDLGTALDESSRSSVRRRWGIRRRARSTGNLPSCHKFHSDDSSSSIGEIVLSRDKGLSSLQQSDSDEVSPNAERHIAPFSLRNRQVHQIGNFESDSFNENFSPVHPNTRRKRKFKRMAVDVAEMGAPSTSGVITGTATAKAVVVPHSTICKKKRSIVRHAANCEFRYNSIICGKRKRSARERSLEIDASNTARSKSNRALTLKMNQDERMDCSNLEAGIHCEIMSSSSLSSSESDTGIYTNDEGREGDDEQSDWFGGAGTDRKDWWDVSETDGDDTDNASGPKPNLNLINISEENRQSRPHMQQFLRDSLNGREIRAGRRRVRVDRPGFSIVTSANEKLSRFLQDPAQSQLRLHPMQPKERDQLCHLATLYSLDMTSDNNHPGLTCPVLTKTRNTTQAVRIELNRMQARHHHLTEFKRRRRLPPAGSSGIIQPHSAPGI